MEPSSDKELSGWLGLTEIGLDQLRKEFEGTILVDNSKMQGLPRRQASKPSKEQR